jgi:hypothetical protein
MKNKLLKALEKFSNTWVGMAILTPIALAVWGPIYLFRYLAKQAKLLCPKLFKKNTEPNE